MDEVSEYQRQLAMARATGAPNQYWQNKGAVQLRDAMGGPPAFWGPLNQMLFGYPLYGRPQSDVNADMYRQMGQSDAISQAALGHRDIPPAHPPIFVEDLIKMLMGGAAGGAHR